MTKRSNRPCDVPGCSNPHRAKGLCSTHYNQRDLNRHPVRAAVCSWCGAPVMKYPAGARRPVCSYDCRRRLQFGDIEPHPKRSKELVGPVRVEKPTTPPTTVIKGSHWKWIAGACEWCGAQFVKATQSLIPRTCSDRCMNKVCQSRREGRIGRFHVSPARRRRLYERDNWTCQLCFEPIDRDAHYLDDWAPSLDHIIPQSHTLAPDHSDANLRTAHRWCNAVRGDESHYTAADLVA